MGLPRDKKKGWKPAKQAAAQAAKARGENLSPFAQRRAEAEAAARAARAADKKAQQ
jgi:hypothetical protein